MIKRIFKLGKGANLTIIKSPGVPDYIKFYKQLKHADLTVIDDIEAQFVADKVETLHEIFSNERASYTRNKLGPLWEQKVTAVFPTLPKTELHKALHSVIGITLFEYLQRDPHYSFDAYKVLTTNSGYMIYRS